MQKKQRVYQDYEDDEDNEYPLGTGQIDFEDFDYDLQSPVKRDNQNKASSLNPLQIKSLKKSDQTKPSTDKQFIKNQLNSLSSAEEGGMINLRAGESGVNNKNKAKDQSSQESQELKFRLNLLASNDDFGTGEFGGNEAALKSRQSLADSKIKMKGGIIRIEDEMNMESMASFKPKRGAQIVLDSDDEDDHLPSKHQSSIPQEENKQSKAISSKPKTIQNSNESNNRENLNSHKPPSSTNLNSDAVSKASEKRAISKNKLQMILRDKGDEESEEEEDYNQKDQDKAQKLQTNTILNSKQSQRKDSKQSEVSNQNIQTKNIQNKNELIVNKQGKQGIVYQNASKNPSQQNNTKNQKKNVDSSDQDSGSEEENTKNKKVPLKQTQLPKSQQKQQNLKQNAQKNNKPQGKTKQDSNDSESGDSNDDRNNKSWNTNKTKPKNENQKNLNKNKSNLQVKGKKIKSSSENSSNTDSEDEERDLPVKTNKQSIIQNKLPNKFNQIKGAQAGYQPPKVNLQKQKIDRDDMKRKSSGPHDFKKAKQGKDRDQDQSENDGNESEIDMDITNQSSHQKNKAHIQPKKIPAKDNSREDEIQQKQQNIKRKGEGNQIFDKMKKPQQFMNKRPIQDQDISAHNPPTNSNHDSDEEDLKQLQQKLNQQNGKNTLLDMSQNSSQKNLEKYNSNISEIELKKQKSPSFNKIDFYSQEKLPIKYGAKNQPERGDKYKVVSRYQQDQKDNSNDEDDEKDEDDGDESSSVEIMEDDYGFSSNPLSQDTNARKAAKGFAKHKQQEMNPSSVDEADEDDRQDHVMDTNPENNLLEHKKKNRMSVKTENFFDFDYKDDKEEGVEPQPDDHFYMEEQGVAWTELNKINEYFAIKKKSKLKRRRRMIKYLRVRNLFFTSKWFMFFHMLENVLFWMVVLVFPVISVIGCDGGFQWMSHVAMAFYLGLFFIFDSVFAFQYISSQSTKFDLKGYGRNKTNRSGKCCHMLGQYFYCLFEMFLTIIGLFDIYCDMAFANLVYVAGIQNLAIVAFFSISLILLPKLYSLVLQLLVLFCRVREEDKKRKYASRILIIDEYRMQAANIDYTHYQKSKTDLLYGLYKFCFEDLPQFIIKVIFLTQYDCGKKYPNGIVYCGLLMAIFNTYFGLLYRFGSYCYNRKRLKSYRRKIEIKVNNQELAQFGFRHIRNNIRENIKVQSVVLAGQNYQFMLIDQNNIQKYEKFIDSISKPDRLEFFEMNKINFKSVRQEKLLFKAIDKKLTNLRYLTIQECNLCPNFILQFKIFLDGNDSLARLSLIHNRMPEDDCYEVLETCLEHPNLEIIQLAERNYKQVQFEADNKQNGNDKDKNNKGKAKSQDGKPSKNNSQENRQPMLEKPSAISVCRGIQFRLQQSESLKLLEIRFLNLSRSILQAIFKGLSKNKQLQRLVLTNEALHLATIQEYKMLGESLKVNQALLCVDLQENETLNDNTEFHSEIIDCLISSQHKSLKRFCLTTESLEVKAKYLELLDVREEMTVFIGNKPLEDVDIQE